MIICKWLNQPVLNLTENPSLREVQSWDHHTWPLQRIDPPYHQARMSIIWLLPSKCQHPKVRSCFQAQLILKTHSRDTLNLKESIYNLWNKKNHRITHGINLEPGQQGIKMIGNQSSKTLLWCSNVLYRSNLLPNQAHPRRLNRRAFTRLTNMESVHHMKNQRRWSRFSNQNQVMPPLPCSQARWMKCQLKVTTRLVNFWKDQVHRRVRKRICPQMKRSTGLDFTSSRILPKLVWDSRIRTLRIRKCHAFQVEERQTKKWMWQIPKLRF